MSQITLLWVSSYCCESLHIVMSQTTLLWVSSHCCESTHIVAGCFRSSVQIDRYLKTHFHWTQIFLQRSEEIYFQFNAGVTKRFPCSDLRRWIFMVRLLQWLCGDIIKETIVSVLFTSALAILKPVSSTKNVFSKNKLLKQIFELLNLKIRFNIKVFMCTQS